MAINKNVVRILEKNYSKKQLKKLLDIKANGTAMLKDRSAVGPMDPPYMDKMAREEYKLMKEVTKIQSGKKIERVPLKKSVTRIKLNKEENIMPKKVPLTKREQELQAIEEYIKKHGVIKTSGKGPVVLDDDLFDNELPEPDLEPVDKGKKSTKKVEQSQPKQTKEVTVKKSTKKVEQSQPKQTKEVTVKKSTKKVTKKAEPIKKAQPKPTKEVTVKKSTKKVTSVSSPFEGDTFGNYTIDIPDKAFGSKKRLIEWMLKENRLIIEYKKNRGKLGAYQPERNTESGRVATVTVKKQGERHVVTYRSNKNSKKVTKR